MSLFQFHLFLDANIFCSLNIPAAVDESNPAQSLISHQLLYCRVGIGFHLQILMNGSVRGVHEPSEYSMISMPRKYNTLAHMKLSENVSVFTDLSSLYCTHFFHFFLMSFPLFVFKAS